MLPARQAVVRLIARTLSLLAILVCVNGCYYMQAVRGQLDVMRHREPVDAVLSDPDTTPELAARLRVLVDARRFASETLLLPDNDSYRSYADLERNYVVWNVIAAPEFSLQPKTWCYLVVGCVAYRGYFEQSAAERTAARLRDDDYDVFVGGVTAYSTLGRFADPILNTMLRRDDADIVELLFHELAHQRLYIRDDTEFNESYASAVAEIGLRRWLTGRGEAAALERWRDRQATEEAMTRLMLAARRDLEALYARTLPAAEMRRRKHARLERLASDARDMAGASASAGWLGGELNNARLASMSLYRRQVSAFLALFARCDDDLHCFYRETDRISALPDEARRDALTALAAD